MHEWANEMNVMPGMKLEKGKKWWKENKRLLAKMCIAKEKWTKDWNDERFNNNKKECKRGKMMNKRDFLLKITGI